MRCVQNFTPPEFQAETFTLSISPKFNSFSGKNTKKMSENGEIYTAGQKILHWQWRQGQISPLFFKKYVKVPVMFSVEGRVELFKNILLNFS